jgi:predicted nucleic acid-binding protein
MAESAPAHLLDTNILLRLSKRDSPEFATIRNVLRFLSQNNTRLCYTSQNLIEFWNVATRPIERNGYGLPTVEADEAARRVERAFILLPDTEGIHHEWRRLVVSHGVSGAKVHDARLVAAMTTHGVAHILTFNDRDFSRYAGITVVHPSDIPV